MKKVLILMLALFCLTTVGFAINADPDPDMAEKWAFEAKITLPPVLHAKGNALTAGDYYIPKGSHELGFDSLHIAVDSINANGVTGTVNLILDADTLREPTFTFNAALSSANNVVVKPATGRNVCLIVTGGVSMGNGVQMIGFNTGYVTFDGSNNGTDSQNLTVTTEDITPVVDVPFGLNAATADTVVLKNMIIKNLGITGQTNFRYGAVINDKGGVWGFRVENCQIGTVERPVRRDGIAPWGGSSIANQFEIINNEVYSGTRGVATLYLTESEIIGNTFNLMPTTAANTNSYNHGIYITGAVGNTTIHNNVVNCLEKTNIAGTYLIGIAFAGNQYASKDIISIVNNMINVGAADETGNTYGIGFRSAGNMGNLKVFHNTVLINEHSSTLTSYAIGNHTNGTGPVNVDLKNNIIMNNHTVATSAAIGLVPATSVLTSDYNMLVANQLLVNYQGTTYADLTAWQATGQDAKSVSKDVTFMGAADLHLAATSDTDLDLVMPKIAGIQTDIDGDPRGNTAYAYAGADEGTVYPSSNDFTLTFNDASDVANWSHHDEANGYTVEAWAADSTLMLSDASWSMIAKRPIIATPGWIYKLSIDIKTSNWEGKALDLTVQGLGNDAVKKSIVSDGAWTTFTIIGTANAENGYIRIVGGGNAVPDTVWVDNVVWNDIYRDLSPSASIADVRGMMLGDTMAVVGIATTTKEFGSSGPVYIQDGTAGIAVYNYAAAQNVALGDEILAIGKLKSYNGLLEVDPLLDYMVLSQNNVVEPVVITALDMDGEAYEGMLVTIERCDTLETGLDWPAAGSNKGNTLKDGNDSTFYCYLDKDTDIDGSPKPTFWPIDITGIVSDYNGAQLMPRSLADFRSSNKAPSAFTIVSPADSTEIVSFDDPNLEKVPGVVDSVWALRMVWTKSVDPDIQTVSYRVMISPNGPEEELITLDTFMYIPIDNERPWDMNGTYDAFVIASDSLDGVTHSDTVTLIFNFPVPPEVIYADVVLMDGTPKVYATFNMPVEGVTAANFSIVDADPVSNTVPTAVDSIAPNIVLISGDLLEDQFIALAYTGIVTPGGVVSVTDTAYAGEVLIPFSANHPEDAVGIITDFESNVGSFVAVTYSGSTAGILPTSTFAASDEEAYRGTKSGKYTLLDDPAKTGWYVRHLYGYPFAYTVKTSSKLMFMVKGTDANVEMRLSITENPGYEQGPWTRVSVNEDDWQVVSFDLLNDEAQGWVNGNGIVEGATVLIEGIHMRCSEDVDVVLYIDEFTERKTDLVPVDVTFEVGMAVQTLLGNFNVGSDFVDVAGNFNEWGGTAMVLADTDGDTVYSYTVSGLLPGQKLEYKFRINGSWDDNTAEFPYGGPARIFTVPDTNSVVFHWYKNEDRSVLGIDDLNALPKVFALHQNYPNPFNPITTIKYDLPKEAHVKIMIFDVMGREVRTLVNTRQQAGYQAIQWNARDNSGRNVSSGYYMYVMKADKFHKTQKMILLK